MAPPRNWLKQLDLLFGLGKLGWRHGATGWPEISRTVVLL
jgi:hypothetical protein